MGLTLKSPSERMSSNEQQILELNGLKKNMVRLQITVDHLDGEVERANRNVQEYDSTIQTYSDMCDGLRIDKRMSDSLLEALRVQVEHLQAEQDQSKTKVTHCDDTTVGTDEPEFVPNEPEDTENTLGNFLQRDMNINERLHSTSCIESEKLSKKTTLHAQSWQNLSALKTENLFAIQRRRLLKENLLGFTSSFPKWSKTNVNYCSQK